VLYADGVTPGRYGEADLDFLAAFASQAAVAIGNERLWRRIEQEAVVRNTLLRFFPPSTATKVLEGGSMAPTETEVTALFCDISGYTALSATLTPMQVLELLNAYFPAVAEVVFAYGGTLEKYVGDALLAVWGAPFAQPDDADRAMQAALAMQKAVDALCAGPKWKFPPLRVHIGLHTGRVAAGTLGTDRYLQYATIGDATNIASRVCGTAEAGQVVASDSTWSRLAKRPPAVRIQDVQVKGREEPLVLWRVLPT
jgi:adenylate cyclase